MFFIFYFYYYLFYIFLIKNNSFSLLSQRLQTQQSFLLNISKLKHNQNTNSKTQSKINQIIKNKIKREKKRQRASNDGASKILRLPMSFDQQWSQQDISCLFFLCFLSHRELESVLESSREREREREI